MLYASLLPLNELWYVERTGEWAEWDQARTGQQAPEWEPQGLVQPKAYV